MNTSEDTTRAEATHYVFEFFEIRKPDCLSVNYDLIESINVDLKGPGTGTMHSRLHAWALTVLAEGRYEIGLYAACCNGNDESDYPVTSHGEVMIMWDGRTELAFDAT